MGLAVTLLIACVVCCVFCGLLALAYMIINKPQEVKQSLISDALARELMAKQAAMTSDVTYTNVWSTQIGFDSDTILQTIQVDAPTCMATCNGRGGDCRGFQMRNDGTTCDLLNGNVSSTYGFSNANWNYFQVEGATPEQIFGTAIENQGGGGAQVGSTIFGATLQACAKYCKSNASSGCTTIELGDRGCKMFNKDGGGYGRYQVNGSKLYDLQQAQYSIATATPPSSTPAPSSS